MVKKTNFDSTIKKAEVILSKVNIIMQNRLIIALFLIIDGITFILNPNGSLAGMARNVIILVLLASFSILVANICSKTKDVKTIVISTVIIIIGIIIYIYPDLVSAYIQLILSAFIICNGVINIVKTLNLNKLSKYTKVITEKYNKIVNHRKVNKKNEERKEKFKDVNKNFNEGMERQKEKLITPLKSIVNKSSKFSALYITTNVASIILGIILIIFPDVSMTLWGIIFLYAGIPDLLVAIRTMDVSRKIKEKKFKEILYDEDKKQNKSDEEKQILK